jgi:AhpD family alkylhydroperoxidase
MNYRELTSEISAQLAKFRQEIPEVAQGFSALSSAAYKGEALDKKTKELIAMAIAVASRCQGCIGFHAQALNRLGVTRQEFIEMLGVAIYMGGGPSYMTAAEALKAYEEFGAAKEARST